MTSINMLCKDSTLEKWHKFQGISKNSNNNI